jgi:hypothetical protein
VDSRLPGGGGNVISGLYDLNPDVVAGGIPTSNYTTRSDNYGNQISHWNGVDFTTNVRPIAGVQVAGGLSTGRTSTDNCDVVAHVVLTTGVAGTGATSNNPSQLYCHIDTNFLTQVKLYGAYTIPRIDVQAAATFQSIPGPQISSLVPYTSATVVGLGRPLSNATVVNVNVVPPGTLFGERLNQLDFRVGKIFRYGRSRTNVNFDLYNALNVDTVTALNNNYTGPWLTPINVVQGRLAKLSVQFNF